MAYAMGHGALGPCGAGEWFAPFLDRSGDDFEDFSVRCSVVFCNTNDKCLYTCAVAEPRLAALKRYIYIYIYIIVNLKVPQRNHVKIQKIDLASYKTEAIAKNNINP